MKFQNKKNLIIAYINYIIRQANCKLPICREVYICVLNIIMNEKFNKIIIILYETACLALRVAHVSLLSQTLWNLSMALIKKSQFFKDGR